MKKFLFVSVLAMLALGTTFAGAQQRKYSPSNPPHDLWCFESSAGNGGGWRVCSAYTFEQCLASRYSQSESCYMNPLYDARFQRSKERQ